uniref:MYM-type domain-containing protein n=1 Tax=viral metagenome TaxID=1070528 RepID=A0A6C0AMM9_9ZZZZ
MPKVSKTKVKAKVPIVAVVSANGDIQGSFSPEPRRPLIAHLPFRSTEIQFQDGPLAYDPRPPVVPEPYEADDLYTSNAEVLENLNGDRDTLPKNIPVAVESHKEEPVKQEVKVFRTMDVMLEYHVANESQTLPESVEAACFWCAGCFEGRPVVIPSLEEHGCYKVYGNFCTLSCSLSYLLNEQVDPQVRWERQALLHRMYAQPESIHPAPPRESLKFFGGVLSYEQYREIIEKKKIRIDTNLPPVISILATLDTKPIDFYETSLRNTSAAGAGIDVVKTLEPGLRLKRSKPLKDKESTLDAVMNLSVKVRG